jgi:hypothetical protein
MPKNGMKTFAFKPTPQEGQENDACTFVAEKRQAQRGQMAAMQVNV